MSLATLWCLLFFSWIYGAQGQEGEPCSGSWEIGKPQPLSCTSNHLTDVVTIQMKVNNGYVNVSSCKLLGRQCTDNMAPVYTTIYFDLVEVDGEKLNAMLVYINGTRLNENTFRCVVDDRPTNPKCFEMFAIPAKPVCDPPTLINSNTQLNITCTSDRVYPDAYLGIAVIHGGQLLDDTNVYSPDNYENEFHTSLSPSLTHPGYYVKTIQTHVFLSTLEPDTYHFIVLMHPLISNTTLANEMFEFNLIENVVLTTPVVRLSSDCPVDSYITSGTCTCNLTTPGYPPGQARWYTQSEQGVGTNSDDDSSSTLIFSQESPASYECRAETVLNVTSLSTVSFVPKFPFGPSTVIIESSVVDGIFNLCPTEDHITVVVTCKVPTEDVKPGVTFTILVNNDIVVDQQEANKIDSHYISHYSFRPSKGGSCSIECRAQNSIAPRLSFSKRLTFEVREPPPSSPVFHIPPNQSGSEVANVVLGNIIHITCKVDGGYRKVSEVTITCGSRKQQDQTNIATLTAEVTKSMDGQTCYCSATHDSGCYDEESEVLLKVVSEDAEASKEDQGSDEDQTLIVALSAAAAVVVIALGVVIVILFMRKRKRNAVPPNNNNIGLHPVPSYAEQGGYITPRPPAYSASAQNTTLPKAAPPNPGPAHASSDYATVIVNDDIASNRDWSYNNPTFTDPHEYNRLSNDYDQVSDVFSSSADYWRK